MIVVFNFILNIYIQWRIRSMSIWDYVRKRLKDLSYGNTYSKPNTFFLLN